MQVPLLGSNHNNCRMRENRGKGCCARFRCGIVFFFFFIGVLGQTSWQGGQKLANESKHKCRCTYLLGKWQKRLQRKEATLQSSYSRTAITHDCKNKQMKGQHWVALNLHLRTSPQLQATTMIASLVWLCLGFSKFTLNLQETLERAGSVSQLKLADLIGRELL